MLRSPCAFQPKGKVLPYSRCLSEAVLSHSRRSRASLGAHYLCLHLLTDKLERKNDGSTSIRGNERATIKAHPATPHRPRPYRKRISPAGRLTRVQASHTIFKSSSP